MADLSLSQTEADALISMPKVRVSDEPTEYPDLGGSICVPLISEDRREDFLLDVGRGRIDLRKVTYQTRARRVVILVRLDLGGPPHTNPDGAHMPCPHLHLYREGYGAKWAFPVPPDSFGEVGDLSRTLDDFLRYCNVNEPWPIITRGLFS